MGEDDGRGNTELELEIGPRDEDEDRRELEVTPRNESSLNDDRRDLEIAGRRNRLPHEDELRLVVREVMQEFLEGNKRTESLEKRVNELIAENQETQRSASIRAGLQKLGVAKVELAYKAVKDDIYRGEDGRILAQGGLELGEYLANFVNENPELLPARLTGGSGASGSQKLASRSEGIDLASIRPGMSAEEMDRVRREVARVASQTLKGWQ